MLPHIKCMRATPLPRSLYSLFLVSSYLLLYSLLSSRLMVCRKFDYKDAHQILSMKIVFVSPEEHTKQMRRGNQGGAVEKQGIEEEQDETEVDTDETAKEVIADLVRRYPLLSSLSLSLSFSSLNQVDEQKIL